ncbi:MAG TPA: helix-turn-helix transcriptional regulator [Candidatus Obscuribacterales bacterium]
MPTPATPQLSKRLGELIGQRRQKLGISQEELVQRAKISRSYYSDIERGLRNMSVQSLCNIARALGTTGYELLHQAELAEGEQAVTS